MSSQPHSKELDQTTDSKSTSFNYGYYVDTLPSGQRVNTSKNVPVSQIHVNEATQPTPSPEPSTNIQKPCDASQEHGTASTTTEPSHAYTSLKIHPTVESSPEHIQIPAPAYEQTSPPEYDALGITAKSRLIWPWIAGASALLAILLVFTLVLVLGGVLQPVSSRTQSEASEMATSQPSESSAPKSTDRLKIIATVKVNGEAKVSYGNSAATTREDIAQNWTHETEIQRKDGFSVVVDAGYTTATAAQEMSCTLTIDGVEYMSYTATGGTMSSVRCTLPREFRNPELTKAADREQAEKKTKISAVVHVNGKASVTYGTYPSKNIKSIEADWTNEQEVEGRYLNDYNIYVSSPSEGGASEISCTVSIDGVEKAKQSATGAGSYVSCRLPSNIS